MKRNTVPSEAAAAGPRVVIVGGTDSAYVREVGLGLRQATGVQPRWSIRLNERLDFALRLKPDAILAQVGNAEQEDQLLRAGVPTVNFSGWLAQSRLPRVEVDNAAAGRMAADHLVERGFSRFACVGHRKASFSQHRMEGFAAAVRGHGGVMCPQPARLDEAVEHSAAMSESIGRDLRAWAQAAGGAVGLFVTTDTFASRYLDAFLKIGVRVPEQVAVVGVDDDELLCELCDPPLSSVRMPGEQIGVAAAELLGDLLAGREPRRHEWLLPPAGVRVRQSTDVEAVDDPLVADAMHYIRLHFAEALSAAEVAERADVSRRMFELRFKKAVGHTVGHQIILQRLDHAKELLATTDRPITRIAYDCGFSTPQRLNEAFRRVLRTSPSAYRRQHRASSRYHHVP